MKTFLKITMSILALLLIQMYFTITRYFDVPSVLNSAWFTVSFWILGFVSCLYVIGIIPTVANISEKDGDEFIHIKDYGLEELNRYVFCWPFLICAVVFLQYNSPWQAVMSIAIWLLQITICYAHSKELEAFYSSEAQKGTKK